MRVLSCIFSLLWFANFLYGITGSPLSTISFQYGVPFRYKNSTNYPGSSSVRGKYISDFTFPYSINLDFGYLIRLKSRHTLMGIFDISYEADPVNLIFDRDPATKFYDLDPVQESLNTFFMIKHRWAISETLLLNNTLDYSVILNGYGRGDFKGNFLNAHMIGFQADIHLHSLHKKAVFGNSPFFHHIAGMLNFAYHVSFFPNDEEIGFNIISEQTGPGNTLELEEGRPHFNNFILGYGIDYFPTKSLTLSLNHKWNGDFYFKNKILDNDGKELNRLLAGIFLGSWLITVRSTVGAAGIYLT